MTDKLMTPAEWSMLSAESRAAINRYGMEYEAMKERIAEQEQERTRKQRNQRVDCAPYTVIHDPLPFEDGGLKVGVARFAKEDITASIRIGSMSIGMRFRHQRDGKQYEIARVNRAVKLVEVRL